MLHKKTLGSKMAFEHPCPRALDTIPIFSVSLLLLPWPPFSLTSCPWPVPPSSHLFSAFSPTRLYSLAYWCRRTCIFPLGWRFETSRGEVCQESGTNYQCHMETPLQTFRRLGLFKASYFRTYACAGYGLYFAWYITLSCYFHELENFHWSLVD